MDSGPVVHPSAQDTPPIDPRHMTQEEREELRRSRLTCCRCHIKFKHKAVLDRHLLYQTQCSSNTLNPSKRAKVCVTEHLTQKGSNAAEHSHLKCPHCQFQFKLKTRFDSHLEGKICLKRWYCSRCDKEFTTKEGWVYHMKENVCLPAQHRVQENESCLPAQHSVQAHHPLAKSGNEFDCETPDMSDASGREHCGVSHSDKDPRGCVSAPPPIENDCDHNNVTNRMETRGDINASVPIGPADGWPQDVDEWGCLFKSHDEETWLSC